MASLKQTLRIRDTVTLNQVNTILENAKTIEQPKKSKKVTS